MKFDAIGEAVEYYCLTAGITPKNAPLGLRSKGVELTELVLKSLPKGTGYNMADTRVGGCLYALVLQYRGKLRKRVGVKLDARTHSDVKDRNMHDAHKIHIDVLKKLAPLVKAVGVDKLLGVCEEFHSLDHFVNAVEHTAQMAEHYDLVAV